MIAQANAEAYKSTLELNKAIQETLMATKQKMRQQAMRDEKMADEAEKMRTIRQEDDNKKAEKARKKNAQKANLEELRQQESDNVAKKNAEYAMNADTDAPRSAVKKPPMTVKTEGKFGKSPKGPTGVALCLGFGGPSQFPRTSL